LALVEMELQRLQMEQAELILYFQALPALAAAVEVEALAVLRYLADLAVAA
jgi:hypothetical protein